MTQPRQIFPGATYLVTRRCLERRMLLVPRGPVNDVFGYCLGLAAERYGVDIHGFCALSNHHHLVCTDPHGRICDFARDLHGSVARCLNAHFARWDKFWSAQRVSLVRLSGPDDVLAKLIYTATNPVKAGLVPRLSAWPGLHSKPEDILGAPRTFRRPKMFFRKDGPCPEQVDLVITVPPQFAHLAPATFASELRNAITQREHQLQAEHREAKRTYTSREALCAQSRDATPATNEPRRGIDPAIACRDTPQRIAEIAQLVAFRANYHDARRRWLRANGAPVTFPEGTLLMRRYPGVHCPRPRPPDTHRAVA